MNPCIDCNKYLKFNALYSRADALGYDYVATGHYARITFDENNGRYLLKKGVDDSKDQSYVLYNLTQKQLSRALFPLGEYTKEEIRKIAAEKINSPLRAKAKIRYNMKEQSGILFQTDDDTIVFEFDEPQRAATAGQSLVVYDGDTVLCGGEIK